MGGAENNSKKRAALGQLSRDNPEESSEQDQETGTFKKASDDVIASRRIVKVRRNTNTSSSNPFAGIQLVNPVTPSVALTDGQSKETIPEKVEEKTDENDKNVTEAVPEEPKLVDEKTIEGIKADEEGKKEAAEAINGEGEAKEDAEDVATESEEKKEAEEAINVEGEASKDAEDVKTGTEEKKETEEAINGEGEAKKDAEEKKEETSPFNSFQQLSSGQNAFTGLSGTGFTSSSFSFGSITKNDSSSASASNPPFSFNGNSSLFGHPGISINKSEASGFPAMKEVSTETGEENEKVVFKADSVLFEFSDGSWKERGKGEVKVNVSTTEIGKARLVMRTKGNYRLILNASLYPDMKLTNMDKKGITFACVNSASEGKDGLSTHALKFKDVSFVEEFRGAVMEHKDKTVVSLKTPENSPKASDE